MTTSAQTRPERRSALPPSLPPRGLSRIQAAEYNSVENLRRWLAVGAYLLALGAGYLTVDLNLVGAAGWLAAGLLALALRAGLAIYVIAAQRADDLLAQLSALLADDLDDAPTPTGRPE